MFRRLFWILTLNCRPFSRLSSDALDRRLSSSERVAFAGHWISCKSCRRYSRQLRLLDALGRDLQPASATESLTAERRARLRERILEELRKSP